VLLIFRTSVSFTFGRVDERDTHRVACLSEHRPLIDFLLLYTDDILRYMYELILRLGKLALQVLGVDVTSSARNHGCLLAIIHFPNLISAC
jgi:ABC-type transport system involved in cytochrome c biogenesis permease component